MKKTIWRPVLVLSIFLVVLYCAQLEKAQASLSGKLIRLHVVANSDSESDQTLKLKVRDEVLSGIAPLLEGLSSREEAEEVLTGNLNKVKAMAEGCLKQNGVNAKLHVSLEREMFPERDYESFSLPAGEYTALRIVIGEGKGQNWWCVMFPPLCYEAALENGNVSRDAFAGLTGEEAELITGKDDGYVVKFWLLDFFAWVKKSVTGK